MFKEYRDILNGNYKRRAARTTVIGALSGLLAGASAGILLAPKSGKETRKDIATGVKKGTAKVKDIAETAAEATREKFEELKNRTEKVAPKAEPVKTAAKKESTKSPVKE